MKDSVLSIKTLKVKDEIALPLRVCDPLLLAMTSFLFEYITKGVFRKYRLVQFCRVICNEVALPHRQVVLAARQNALI